jgi:hypothetical protein
MCLYFLNMDLERLSCEHDRRMEQSQVCVPNMYTRIYEVTTKYAGLCNSFRFSNKAVVHILHYL